MSTVSGYSAVQCGVSTVSGTFNDTKFENLAVSSVELPILSASCRYRDCAHIGARCWLLSSCCLWQFNKNPASDALCDAAHRLLQGVLYFQAVMPLHSAQLHVASFSPIRKATYGFHLADFHENHKWSTALAVCISVVPSFRHTVHVDSTDRGSFMPVAKASFLLGRILRKSQSLKMTERNLFAPLITRFSRNSCLLGNFLQRTPILNFMKFNQTV